jgi:hypothetical protein
MSRSASALFVLALACASDEAPPAEAAPDAPPRPADSLALRAGDGWEVWFTLAREARHADGTHCVERALEFRRDTVRRGIPLLYTREAPTALGQDAIRAVLYNHCAPTAAYRVDFATVSPSRLAP